MHVALKKADLLSVCRLRGHSGVHSILIKKYWSQLAKGKENSMLFSCWAESDLTVGGDEASLFYFIIIFF